VSVNEHRTSDGLLSLYGECKAIAFVRLFQALAYRDFPIQLHGFAHGEAPPLCLFTTQCMHVSVFFPMDENPKYERQKDASDIGCLTMDIIQNSAHSRTKVGVQIHVLEAAEELLGSKSRHYIYIS
jgi:TPP-dependent indolepyruvate ferredoxin oxidoreductase alpha subunit